MRFLHHVHRGEKLVDIADRGGLLLTSAQMQGASVESKTSASHEPGLNNWRAEVQCAWGAPQVRNRGRLDALGQREGGDVRTISTFAAEMIG